MSGEYLPFNKAVHLAVKINACDARGPAPHSRYSLASGSALVVWGLVFCTSETAYFTTLSVTGTLRTNCWKYWICSPDNTCLAPSLRSEERRVGKECTTRGAPEQYKKRERSGEMTRRW